MPELPDVEHYRKEFDAHALNQPIEQVQVESESLLSGISAERLGQALKHRRFQYGERYGKWLLIRLDNEKFLVMHFGMTGKLTYFDGSQSTPRYTRLTFCFDNGNSLAYVSPRKLGRVQMADSRDSFIESKQLGADALAVSETQFLQMAAGQRAGVKAWLMNQQVLAGIGNVYSDEILFQTRLHPNCSLAALDKTRLRKLYKAMHSVLTTAVKRDADPKNMPSSYLLPQRKNNGHCPGCGSTVEKVKAGGRGAWYCPKCQSEDTC